MSEDLNEKVAANPTTPEPEAAPQEAPKDPATELLAELEKMGVNNPEDLQGMATASQQTGKAWNEVGELRKVVEQQAELLRQAQQAPVDPYADGQSVDLGKLVENKVQGVLDNYLKSQNQATEAYYRELAEVQSNPRYAAVEAPFQAHIQSPATAMRLRTGQTTLREEFHRVKDIYTDALLKRAYDNLSPATPATAKPPHVESGDTQAPVTPRQDDEITEKINRTVKARQSGLKNSDDALRDIVNTFLPKDDSMWQI